VGKCILNGLLSEYLLVTKGEYISEEILRENHLEIYSVLLINWTQNHLLQKYKRQLIRQRQQKLWGRNLKNWNDVGK
jgi:hypothetical protein